MNVQKALKPLRALDVYSVIPAGCIVHQERDDKHFPHIRSGEVVVVDITDREPIRGELFLIEWIGGGRDVMQATLRRLSGVVQPDGSLAEEELWTLKGLGFCLSEGPMREEYLRTKIVGRVAGLYQPDFDASALKTIGRAA